MSNRKTKVFPVEFTNSQGKVVTLSSKITLNDLAAMGIGISLEPKENPKDPNPQAFYHEPK